MFSLVNRGFTKLTRISKALKFLDIIDNIEVTETQAKITLKKDILIENTGSIISRHEGLNIQIAKEIHLNPDISDIQKINILENLEN